MMEANCKYKEYAVTDSRERVVL